MARVFAIFLSAGAYAALFPPWNLSWLAWVGLAPFLLCLDGLSWRQRALAGLVWGLASNFAVGHWVPGALRFYYDQPEWFGVLFCAAASLVYWTPYYIVFALLAGAVVPRHRPLARILLLASLWVSIELARSRGVTSAPWALLGQALVGHTTLIQVADFGSVYVLSFVLMVANGAVVEAWRGRQSAGAFKPLALAMALLGACYAYGAWRLAQPLPQTPTTPTVIVQGNNQQAAYWQPGAYGKGLDDYLRLSEQAVREEHPQVLIWPEAAVTMFLGREPRYQARIAPLLAASGTDLLVGAPHYLDEDPALPEFRNSAFYMTSAGELTGRYDKVRLLPFAEYFPLRMIGFLRRRFERVRSFVPGDGPLLIDTRFGKTAVVICFEGIFSDLVRRRMAQGAQVLVVLSNDVWLGHGAGPAQHLANVVLRAVENRTWTLRATTTGVSAVIDPFGRVVRQSAPFVPALLAAPVVPLQIDTVYKRHGDIFAYACVAIATIASIAALLDVSRRRS